MFSIEVWFLHIAIELKRADKREIRDLGQYSTVVILFGRLSGQQQPYSHSKVSLK